MQSLDQALADVHTARRIEIDIRKLALTSLQSARSLVMRELEAMPETYKANAVVLAEKAFDFAVSDIESKFGEMADGFPSDDVVEERYEEDAAFTLADARRDARAA